MKKLKRKFKNLTIQIGDEPSNICDGCGFHRDSCSCKEFPYDTTPPSIKALLALNLSNIAILPSFNDSLLYA